MLLNDNRLSLRTFMLKVYASQLIANKSELRIQRPNIIYWFVKFDLDAKWTDHLWYVRLAKSKLSLSRVRIRACHILPNSTGLELLCYLMSANCCIGAQCTPSDQTHNLQFPNNYTKAQSHIQSIFKYNSTDCHTAGKRLHSSFTRTLNWVYRTASVPVVTHQLWKIYNSIVADVPAPLINFCFFSSLELIADLLQSSFNTSACSMKNDFFRRSLQLQVGGLLANSSNSSIAFAG